MSEEDIAREEARIARTMAHVGQAKARPRSWANKQAADVKQVQQAIHKADAANGNSTAPPAAADHVHTHHEQDDADNHVVARTEEEKQQALEKQIKAEEERFSRYLAKAPAAQKPHAPPQPRPLSTSGQAKPLVEKNARQAVVLDISGPGSSKGEAGKQATFVIKTKSLTTDESKASVEITVKISAKDASGQVVAIDNHLTHESDDEYHVFYTPTHPGLHTVDVFVNGQTGHTFTLTVAEGAAYPEYTEAKWESLKGLAVGTKAQLVVSPMSFSKKIVPLGYSSLTAKVDNLTTHTCLKNVSVLGDREGHHVVTFYVTEPGEYIITVNLNGHHISGSPYIFKVAE